MKKMIFGIAVLAVAAVGIKKVYDKVSQYIDDLDEEHAESDIRFGCEDCYNGCEDCYNNCDACKACNEPRADKDTEPAEPAKEEDKKTEPVKEKSAPSWDELEHATKDMECAKAFNTALEKIDAMSADDVVKMVDLYDYVETQNKIKDIYEEAEK